MSARCFALALTAAALLSPAALRADQRQFANVIYDLPQGWEIGAVEEDRQYLLSDLPDNRCEYCRIIIGPSQPKQGGLEDYLRENFTFFVEDDEDRAAASMMGEPTFFSMGGRHTGLVALMAGRNLHIFAVMELEDRFELFGFKGFATNEAEVEDSMAAFESSFTPFMENLSFVSEGAKTLLPEATPGELSGMWWGTSSMYTAGLDGNGQMLIFHTNLIFWPDGYFYDGTPPNGTAPVDREALIAAGATDFGIYSVSGNDITLTYSDGRVETATREGEAITLDGTVTYQVELVADGERIEGTIDSFFYSGFAPGLVQGGAVAASYTTFHKDGSYEGASSGGVFANFYETYAGDSTGGFASRSGNTTGGTYEIRDGLIISTPNDGSETRVSLIFRASGDILIGEKFLSDE